MESSLI